MQTLYPDLHRRRDVPPSLIEREARDWVAAEPERWRPTHDYSEPADVLAVIGAMVLSAAVREPLGWDGEALRGPIDPVSLIARAYCGERTIKDRDHIEIVVDDDRLILPAHTASRYWAGRITLDRIWITNQVALRVVIESAERAEAERAASEQRERRTVSLVSMDERIVGQMMSVKKAIKAATKAAGAEIGGTISVTGYDETVVSVPVRDGFAMAAHPDITMAGQRPSVELYAVIGAAYVEAQGRWPTPHRPAIPRIRGLVLRDRLDLDRLMLIGESMPFLGVLAGKRSYLTGCQ